MCNNKAGQGSGPEFQEKQVQKKSKSKRHKANEKNEIPSSPKTSSSDSYINKNSVNEKTEEVENIDEQVWIDDLAKLEEQLKKQPYTEVSKELTLALSGTTLMSFMCFSGL